MTWSSESIRDASADVLHHRELVDRFLDEAARLTNDDWRVIYARYVADQRGSDRSATRFGGASIDAIVRRQRVESKRESAAAIELLEQATAWVIAHALAVVYVC